MSAQSHSGSRGPADPGLTWKQGPALGAHAAGLPRAMPRRLFGHKWKLPSPLLPLGRWDAEASEDTECAAEGPGLAWGCGAQPGGCSAGGGAEPGSGHRAWGAGGAFCLGHDSAVAVAALSHGLGPPGLWGGLKTFFPWKVASGSALSVELLVRLPPPAGALAVGDGCARAESVCRTLPGWG